VAAVNFLLVRHSA